MVWILFLFFLLLLPIAQLALGWSLVRRFLFADSERGEIPVVYRFAVYFLGLVVHLLAIYALRSLGLRWPLAIGLPLLVVLLDRETFRFFDEWKFSKLTLNYVLWLCVGLVLGASLFSPVKGIQTLWVNNYGDLPFHVGMISSFVFGENFPAQYHLYPGESLSYPFLMNLWTASLWWINPTPLALKYIFVFQWMLLWAAVYVALDGDRMKFPPWAVLFGGGTLHFISARLFDHVEARAYTAEAHQLIEIGAPWTPFLSTIWVTQRTALFGAAVLLTALRMFHASLELQPSSGKRARLVLAGLLIGLSPLVHTHFFIVVSAYVVGALVVELLRRYWEGSRYELNQWSRQLGLLLICLAPALLGVAILSGKTSMLQLTPGWLPGSKADLSGFEIALRSLRMWSVNAWPWFAAIVFVAMTGTRKHLLAVVLLLFVLGNSVQLAVWTWDQIKVFLGLYLIFLSVWISDREPSTVAKWAFGILLTIPALFETGRIAIRYPEHGVFTREQFATAQTIRKLTQPGDIVAAAPHHNSAVVLSGRPLFIGYDGTLFSHNIEYHPRKQLNSSASELIACQGPICPDFLLWTETEKQFWKEFVPEQQPALERTSSPELFRLKR